MLNGELQGPNWANRNVRGCELHPRWPCHPKGCTHAHVREGAVKCTMASTTCRQVCDTCTTPGGGPMHRAAPGIRCVRMSTVASSTQRSTHPVGHPSNFLKSIRNWENVTAGDPVWHLKLSGKPHREGWLHQLGFSRADHTGRPRDPAVIIGTFPRLLE